MIDEPGLSPISPPANTEGRLFVTLVAATKAKFPAVPSSRNSVFACNGARANPAIATEIRIRLFIFKAF